MNKKVSILVPVLNEANFIENILNCISNQTYAFNLLEVLIIDGGSTDGTLDIIKNLQNKLKYTLEIYENKNRYQAYALNIGLKNSSGDIIIRMDAHSSYEEDYIRKIVKYLEDNNIINVGGPASTKGYDFMSNIISEAVTLPIAVGGGQYRYSKVLIETDTVFPGAWRKEDLLKINGWNEDWIINEDLELNIRLKRSCQGKIIVDPDIKLTYYPRNSIKKLAKQYFKYAKWRMKTVNVYPEAIRYSHIAAISIIPMAFLLFIIFYILIFHSFIKVLMLFVILYFLYFIVLFNYCMKASHENLHRSLYQIFLLVLCISVMHISWSVGALIGILNYGVPIKAILNKFK